VRVFSLEPGGLTERASFFAYFSGFSGPVHVGAADIDGDGAAEIITGAGPGGGPHVRAISLVGGALVERASFYAYERMFCDMGELVPGPSVCDGVFVGGGDVDSDGVAEVVTGTNRQAGPLRVFKIGAGIIELTSFYPYLEAFRGPVHVAALTPDHGSDPAGTPPVPRQAALAHVDAVSGFEWNLQARMTRAGHARASNTGSVPIAPKSGRGASVAFRSRRRRFSDCSATWASSG
jgi:serralysin